MSNGVSGMALALGVGPVAVMEKTKRGVATKWNSMFCKGTVRPLDVAIEEPMKSSIVCKGTVRPSDVAREEQTSLLRRNAYQNHCM